MKKFKQPYIKDNFYTSSYYGARGKREIRVSKDPFVHFTVKLRNHLSCLGKWHLRNKIDHNKNTEIMKTVKNFYEKIKDKNINDWEMEDLAQELTDFETTHNI